jgi:sugar/nucleoside kinase (ribokinase family)
MVNTKYLVAYSQKLFSVHSKQDVQVDKEPDIASYDVVIVFDYGHGFLTLPLRARIMREARWLAVNAQSNSINYGFNRINEKWPIAHLAVCDELEARLAAHDQDSPIEDVILKLPYPSIIVTLGSQGAVGYANHEFYRERALTDRPVDLLGAGDAVLAVVAPFARAGFSIKELVHLGNVAGMVKVGILGHQGHVSKRSLQELL